MLTHFRGILDHLSGDVRAIEAETVSGMLVAVSIFYCLACSGRVFWLVGRIFFSAAAQPLGLRLRPIYFNKYYLCN